MKTINICKTNLTNLTCSGYLLCHPASKRLWPILQLRATAPHGADDLGTVQLVQVRCILTILASI